MATSLAWNFRLPAVPASVPEARHAVRAALESSGVAVADVELAVSEAVTNVVHHGYRDGRAGAVEVAIASSDVGVEVVVRDRGVGPLLHPEVEALGVGVMLMQTVADRFELAGSLGVGTTVRMDFLFPSGEL